MEKISTGRGDTIIQNLKNRFYENPFLRYRCLLVKNYFIFA